MPSSGSALNPIDPPASLIESIQRAKNILLITHLAPDGDAIGGLMGLTHALRSIGKSIVPGCADQIFDRFNSLSGSHDIVQQTSGSFDLVIALDCADAGRMGSIWAKLNDPKPPLVNIDHHITNTQFGSINWIDPQATATSEIILTLIDQLKIQVTREIATCLLCGIVGDTLGFRTPHTTPRALEYSMRLMEAGAVLSEIMEQQFNRRPLALIRLWGKALNNLQIKDRIAYTTISKAMRTSVGMSGSGDISLSSFLISANEADRAAVLVETDGGQIDLSLRAKSGHDVAKAALALGGGGHPLAAGATIDGPMEIAVKRVIDALTLHR
jgi:bifunctional oligoribonuclease and PAP phosphatase NrnA